MPYVHLNEMCAGIDICMHIYIYPTKYVFIMVLSYADVSVAAGMNILQGDPGFQAHNIFGSALIQRPVLPGAPTMTEAACAVMKPAVSCAGLSGIAHAMSGLATGFPHNLKPSSTHTVMPSCSGPINMQSFSSGAQLSTTQTSGTKYLPNNDRENSAQSQEMPVSVPSIARADVNELLRKLLAAGIIGSKNESSSLHDTSATVHKDDGAFELTSDNSRLMTSGRVKSMVTNFFSMVIIYNSCT